MELEDDRSNENKTRREDWGEYREKTKQKPPTRPLVKLLEQLTPGKAIDLGPGAGTDTLFLLENGWEVLGIDIDPKTEDDIRSMIKSSDNLSSQNLDERFAFKNQDFENLELEKDAYDLVIGFNSLFFCKPESFKKIFKQITDSIKSGGYLLINLLGKNDDWNKQDDNRKTFLSREEIFELLADFEVRENDIKEAELDKETAVTKTLKHWHTFLVRARKK